MSKAKRQRICYNGRQEQRPENSYLKRSHKTNHKNETLKEQKARFNNQAFLLDSIHLHKQSYSHLILFLSTLESF